MAKTVLAARPVGSRVLAGFRAALLKNLVRFVTNIQTVLSWSMPIPVLKPQPPLIGSLPSSVEAVLKSSPTCTSKAKNHLGPDRHLGKYIQKETARRHAAMARLAHRAQRVQGKRATAIKKPSTPEAVVPVHPESPDSVVAFGRCGGLDQ